MDAGLRCDDGVD